MKHSIWLMAIVVTVLSSCTTPLPESVPDSKQHIRFNQVGYYPRAIKEFVVADHAATSFMILNDKGKKVFEGKLVEKGSWDVSGEKLLQGDFSRLTRAGIFSIQLNTGITSAQFKTVPGVYEAALDAAIKSFYFQRASMPIEKQYGGIYQWAGGHPDDHAQDGVQLHGSAGLRIQRSGNL